MTFARPTLMAVLVIGCVAGMSGCGAKAPSNAEAAAAATVAENATIPAKVDPNQVTPGQAGPPTTPTTLDDEAGTGVDPGPQPTAPVAAVAVEAEEGGPVVEELAPARVGLPPVLEKNEAGTGIALDETALLACANNQFAWVALQQSQNEGAATEFGRAAARAQASAVPEVLAQAPVLQGAMASGDPLAVATGFLELCKARGFTS